MPRVPVYDQQVRAGGLPSAAQSSVASPALLGAGAAALTQAGKGLEQAAEVFDRIQARDDQDVAFRTEAALKSEWLDHEAKLREANKGRDAVGYTTKVEQWWAEAGKRYGETLSPGQKKLVSKTLMQSALQAKAGVRFSLGRDTTAAEVQRAIATVQRVIGPLLQDHAAQAQAA